MNDYLKQMYNTIDMAWNHSWEPAESHLWAKELYDEKMGFNDPNRPENMNIVDFMSDMDDLIDQGVEIDPYYVGKVLYQNSLKNLSLWRYWLECNQIDLDDQKTEYAWRKIFF